MPKSLDRAQFKLLILQYTDAYFQIHRDFSTKLSATRMDQIDNYYEAVMYIIKALHEIADSPKVDVLRGAENRISRLSNAIVLLQYEIDLSKEKLLEFLDKTQLVLDFIKTHN